MVRHQGENGQERMAGYTALGRRLARRIAWLGLCLALAGCEWLIVRGSGNEHGIQNLEIGLPF